LGTLFAAQSLKLILLNPSMAGNPVFRGQGGEPIVNEGAYPAILTTEEWAKLQERLDIRRGGRHRSTTATSSYLLSGILRCGHCGGAMSGENKGKHKYYVCSGKKMARELCSEARSHRQADLEAAILEHLGQYVDPERVRELLDTQGQEHDVRDDDELTRATARLKALEQAFLNDLDRVDRGVMNEDEYLTRQEVRRQEQEGLKPRKVDLEASVAAQREVETQTAAVPVQVRSFLEDFGDMDVPQAKVILQGIVKVAYVFNDGRIELEFRG
jgi:site-specific DNA recombinase